MLYTADFETTTQLNDCRVWAYGICEIGGDYAFSYGNNIDDFMKWCAKPRENNIVYFHNLKFDGEFIFYWLYRNEFTHVTDRKEMKGKCFTTLISDKGQFYSIEICFEKSGKKTNKVTIYDSLKKLNFSVAKIAKDFNFDIQKLEIGQYNPTWKRPKNLLKTGYGERRKQEPKKLDLGYKGYRPVGHKLTETEIAYLRNDVEIVARGLKKLFDANMEKMTIGSDALNEYKNTVGKKEFERNFPIPSSEVDEFLRASYKGGWTYLNPRYANKIVNGGVVLDVNSLYPSVMYYSQLPHGKGLYFTGEYKEDSLYPLYVQKFRCQFELKKDHLPTIQIKKDLDFSPTEYLESSRTKRGVLKEVTLTMTNVDLKLFREHYHVYNIEFIDGYKYKSTDKLFKEYIDHWIEEKIKAKKEGNSAMYLIAKLMLNSLYGKFALNPKVRSKYPVYDKIKDKIHYEYGEEEEREPIYIPVGTFITAYAREKTIRASQKVYHRFIYADTDSMHLEGEEMPSDIEIDSNKLGAWDYEFKFDKGKYLRSKCYMEYGKAPNKDEKKYTKITVAGMPPKCYEEVTFDNFMINASYSGKLKTTRVSGGIVLEDGMFTIKEKGFGTY